MLMEVRGSVFVPITIELQETRRMFIVRAVHLHFYDFSNKQKTILLGGPRALLITFINIKKQIRYFI